MSSPIWTRAALSAEQGPLACKAWRMVEAQHRISTLKLVDSLAEQELLEQIVEETKPPVPEDCRGLHYLLLTPFRYPAPFDTRFRRAGGGAGVFYCSDAPKTAVAEVVFYRMLFYAESPETPLPTNPGEFTAFQVQLKTQAALDLTEKPFAKDARWMALSDYSACLALADEARACGTEVIVYASVRCPDGGRNYAVLGAGAFARKTPLQTQSWRILLRPDGALATCEAPKGSLRFAVADFAEDARLGSYFKRSHVRPGF